MAFTPGFHATPTKIRNFLECPRRYFFYHVNAETKRLYPEKSFFTLGHHVHETLRDFFAIEPQDRSEETLFELLESSWEKHTGNKAGFKDTEDEKANKDRAISMLKQFLTTENWRIKPFYLPEKEGDFPGYQSVLIEPGLIFGGIVDRIDEDPDGSLHILDYKTGKGDEPDQWQLPLYAVMVGRLLNRSVSRTSYLFLEHGKRLTEDVTIPGNLSLIKRVKDIVSQIPKTTKIEDFNCRLGDGCFHCNYLLEIGYDPKTGKKLETKPQETLFSDDLPF